MMWPVALTTSLLLASQVSAGILGDAAFLARKDDSVEQKVRRYIGAVRAPIQRRTNSTTWSEGTSAACEAALSSGVSSNPSGMAVCYNIATLDSTTGVFQADLRLYKVADPTGDFADIPSSSVAVGLSYTGATVSPVNESSLKTRSDTETSLISWPRDEEEVERRTTTPTLVQDYAFVGQINKDDISADNATLEQVLLPTVTLTGTATDGTSVNTTLSSSEASYVYGVFAQGDGDAVVVPVSKTEAGEAAIQTLVVASDEPFVLPGTHILLSPPIGAIITGIWAVLFISTVGYGTYGRIQFRDQFRRRSARATKGDMPRI